MQILRQESASEVRGMKKLTYKKCQANRPINRPTLTDRTRGKVKVYTRDDIARYVKTIVHTVCVDNESIS